MKILIIEDDSFMAEDLNTLLGFLGHDCVIASSADYFYDIFVVGGQSFDFVILDIMMKAPERFLVEDHLETGESIMKEIRKVSDVNVCVLTAKDKEDLNIKFDGRDGNVFYIKKPLIDFESIIKIIEG